MRVAGLDVGERRIGIAISDPMGVLARPVEALQVRGLGPDTIDAVGERLARFAGEDDGLERVVIGLPRRLDGTSTDMTAKVRMFADQLATHLGIPTSLQDERLTSREAESRLALRQKDWRARKARLDAAAAAIILQDYLDTHAPAPHEPDLR